MSLVLATLMSCLSEPSQSDQMTAPMKSQENSTNKAPFPQEQTQAKSTDPSSSKTEKTIELNFGTTSWQQLQNKSDPKEIVKIAEVADNYFRDIKNDHQLENIKSSQFQIRDFHSSSQKQNTQILLMTTVMTIEDQLYLGKIVFTDKVLDIPCVYEFAVEHSTSRFAMTDIKLDETATFSNSVVCEKDGSYVFAEGLESYQIGQLLFKKAFEYYISR